MTKRRLGIAVSVLGLLALGLGAAPPPAPPSVPADLVLRNAAVYTVDGARSWAEAVAVSKGRIVFVGANASASPWIASSTKVVDLAGKMVLPAFHDSHVHPVSGGVEALECDLNGLKTQEAILAKVKSYAAEHPQAKWIRGGGWELTLFPDGNPSKALLDSVVPDRPVYISASDGHSVWVNSKALALAGVTKATPDPPYGRIERDPKTGQPSGTLREDAADLVAKSLPKRSAKEHVDGLHRSPAEGERLRTDVAGRGERLRGGPRVVCRPRRPGKADGPGARVAVREHGQGNLRGSAARGASKEVREGPRADERREDLRRRRSRDAHGLGARAVRRLPERPREAQPDARGVPDARHGSRQGGIPDPRSRDRRPRDPGYVRRARSRAAARTGRATRGTTSRTSSSSTRPTSRASASSGSSRTSSRSGPTATGGSRS